MKYFSTQKLVLLSFFLLLLSPALSAQDKGKTPTLKHWMSPEEAKLKHLIGIDKQVTDPPDGPVTNIAEFEKMQSVLIRYDSVIGFGIPYNLIAEMSQQCKITTLLANTNEQTLVTNQYNNQGVNLDNCEFLIAPSDSYWTRDYGPWFVIDGNDELGIVDFTYNRPRPTDNAIPSKVAQEFGFNLFEMDIETAGGNYMCNGMGMASSSQLIWDENPAYTHDQVAQIFEDYLGIENYMVVQDPNNTYIDHIDCWGKFLDYDKVLIRSVPESHPQYDEIEATADYYANQASSFGTPFEVYRVYTPQNQPYTNSLILNDRVFVPITNSQWDDEALASYEEAMPGYEVFGFTGSWESTDALHCRTKGIADQNMIHIHHVALMGDQDVKGDYTLEATIKAFSGAELYSDSVLINYRINQGEWLTAMMSNTGGQVWEGTITGAEQGNQIDYYLYAADQNGNHQYHPFIGAADPHVFFAGQQAFAYINVTPGEISTSAPVGGTSSEVLTICNTGELDLYFDIEANTAVYGEISYEVGDSPASNAYDYNTWDEEGWAEFEVTSSESVEGLLITYDWDTDNYPEESSFHLMSPAGTQATIASANPSGNYTVDMMAFNGEEMNGTWRMWIEDTYGDGGHQATNIQLEFTIVISDIEWLLAEAVSGILAPGDCININIACNAAELEAGIHEGSLTISSNDPDHPELEIPVHFEVTAMGYLSVTPDTMWVTLPEDMYQMATIMNNSEAAVEVLDIQESGIGDIGWTTENISQTFPHILQAGEEMTFYVAIMPGVMDNYEYLYDSVYVTTNVADYYMFLAVNPDLLGSVKDPNKTKVNTYPSPFTDKLTIDLSNSIETVESVIIMDIQGQVVKEFLGSVLNSNQLVWMPGRNDQAIGKGVYLIQIISENHIDAIKVLKTK